MRTYPMQDSMTVTKTQRETPKDPKSVKEFLDSAGRNKIDDKASFQDPRQRIFANGLRKIS